MKCFIRLNLNTYRYTLLFLSLLLGAVSACDFVKDEEGVLASVEETKLFQSDFDRFALVYDIDLSDSVAKEQFIAKWINKMIVNFEATEQLPSVYQQNQEKSQQLLYELNLFALENSFINNSLDTSITVSEIETYFKSQNPIDEKPKQLVQALYVKIPDSIKQADTMKTAYLLKTSKDTALVSKIGKLYGTVFYFEKNKWMSLDQLVRELPLSQEKKNVLFTEKGNSIFELDGYIYFLNIFNTREFVKERMMSSEEKEVIKKHLLKLRINQLRENTEQEILNNASEKYTVNRY